MLASSGLFVPGLDPPAVGAEEEKAHHEFAVVIELLGVVVRDVFPYVPWQRH